MEEVPLLGKMPSQDSRRRYLSGVGLLLAVILLWTGSNFITADLETGDDSWNKPFLITYLNTSSFALYLVPKAIQYLRHRRSRATEAYVPISQHETPAPHVGLRARSRSPSARIYPQTAEAPVTPAAMSFAETAEIAAVWAVAWFVANWSLNASLAWTSVASVTIISSTSSFFTLALGRLVGVESLTRTKVLAVLASFIGVVLVTRSDSTVSTSAEPDLPTHPVLGDFACLLSAAFYAVYSLYIKVRVPDEDKTDMQLVLGTVQHCMPHPGVPDSALPRLGGVPAATLSRGMDDLRHQHVHHVLERLHLCTWTGPMLTTIGLSMTIPLALVISLFVPHASSEAITPLTVAGAVLVCLAFAVLGMQGLEEAQTAGEAAAASRAETVASE